jgi:membrane protein required for colicin V production
MNTIDIGILIVLGIFAVKGFIRGIVIEVFTLAGMIIAYIVSFREMNAVAEILMKSVRIPPVIATTVSFLILFIVIVLLFRWLAGALKLFARWTFIGWLDSFGGVVFGLFKGALIASLFLLLFSVIPLSSEIQAWQDDSLLFQPVRSVAPFVFNTIKKAIPHSKDFYEELRENIAEKTRETTDQFLSKKLDSLKTEMKDIGNTESTDD